jgi:hypothetical protein
MPRALSSDALAAIFAQETGTDKVFLLLLELAHASITPIRVVNNMQPVTFDGHTWVACAFGIALPPEQDEKPPQVRLRIDNVDRLIVEGVRLLTGPATATLRVVFEDPGAPGSATLEAGPFVFTLRGVEYDALEVVGTLAYEDILNDEYPQDAFTPALYPGLFKDL